MPQLYSLYVVYRDGRTILQKDFQIENMEPNLVTGFLSAVSMFLSDLVGRLSENGEKLRTLEREDGRLRIIDREDVKILLEYGTNIYVAVFSTHDLEAIRSRMRALISTIEQKYSKLLENWAGDLSYFREFLPVIDSLIRPFAITERFIPIRVYTMPKSEVPKSLHPLLDAIDGKRSIEELANKLDIPLFQVVVGFQALLNQGAIQLERHVAIEKLVTYQAQSKK